MTQTKDLGIALSGKTAALMDAVAQGNREGVADLAEELADILLHADDIPDSSASIFLLQTLRDKRYFQALKGIGDALIQSGEEHATVHRLFAQSLIDTDELTAANYVLRDLLDSTAQDEPELLQIKGLLGRLHKQLFVNHANSQSRVAIRNLQKAIAAYQEIYQSNPQENLWHGINTVALMARACRDQIEYDGAEKYQEIAADIKNQLAKQEQTSAWDSAILAEAFLALNDGESALEQCKRLADDESVSAFHVASFTRQLREVWGLNSSSEPGSYLLPTLQHAILHKEGGSVSLANLNAVPSKAEDMLQKTLGDAGLMAAKWIDRLTKNARSVARIGQNSSKGLGTGFALRGEDISPQWQGKSLLLTNFHVISPDGQTGGLHWQNAVVTFHGSEQVYRLDNVLWFSPPSPCTMGCPNPNHLDVVIAELDRPPEIEHYFRIGRRLPILARGVSQRVYIIGHPNGGDLSYSMQDNQMLDHEVPLIHYHAPTEPGSSGSPVFNEELELIGIHHAGSFTAPLLNGKKNPATRDKYPANEGVWIQSVIEQVNNG